MMIKTIQYSNFDDFFQNEIYTGKLSNHFVFRGLSSSRYELIPSALRENNKSILFHGAYIIDDPVCHTELFQTRAEFNLLKRFHKMANDNGLNVPFIECFNNHYISDNDDIYHLMNPLYSTWIPKELATLAALAQHHGVITRLLDWTQNIFVALYFASIDAIKRGINGNDDNWDNDFLVVWALNAALIQFRQEIGAAIPLKFVVPPYCDNPNLEAQKGVLSYWETCVEGFGTVAKTQKAKIINRKPLDELLVSGIKDEHPNTVLMQKYEIPITECVNVYKKTKHFGFSASNLFPGYDGIVREIEEDQIARQLKIMLDNKETKNANTVKNKQEQAP